MATRPVPSVPAVFIVTIAKWNAKGAHRWKVVGVCQDLDVARALMVEKFLHVVSQNGQLDENRVYFRRQFAAEQSDEYVEYAPGSRPFEILDVLAAAELADENRIYIPHGDNGFAIRIKEAHWFTEDDLDAAQELWDQHKREKVVEKREKYC